MGTLATDKRCSAPLRLIAALRRAGASEEELRRQYRIPPDEPIPDGVAEPVRVEDMEFLPEDSYRYELWDGKLVRRRASKPRHGAVAGEIVGRIYVYLTTNPIGRVYVAEAGFRSGPDESLYCPDASYISHEREAAMSLDEFAPFAPDIAIEVRSPDNTLRKLETKARYYLEHRGRRVWILDPRDRSARVRRPDAPPQTLRRDEMLTGDDVLPGFEVRVGDLFP
jgi:Uma2 family endonuclease